MRIVYKTLLYTRTGFVAIYIEVGLFEVNIAMVIINYTLQLTIPVRLNCVIIF